MEVTSLPVRFSVLGPLRVWHGRAELEAGPRQQRAVLALLLSRPGRPATIDELVALLWDDRPPASAINVIHGYVGSIRRVLEPGLTARASGRWLIRRSGGYLLTVDDGCLDLVAFRRGVELARRAAAEGRRQDALEILLSGLDLWHGPCASGLNVGVAARAIFAAIDQEYVAAVLTAADLALELGRSAQVLPILSGAADREVLHESVQARLVVALAAVGQQALALERYRLVRLRLAEELGIDPGPALRAAHERVLRQRVGIW